MPQLHFHTAYRETSVKHRRDDRATASAMQTYRETGGADSDGTDTRIHWRSDPGEDRPARTEEWRDLQRTRIVILI